jgi:hypothetical protein
MSSARHFSKSQPTGQTRAEVEADLKASRQAQRDAQANGQHRVADMMRGAVDEHLDELNELNNGSWTPKHA